MDNPTLYQANYQMQRRDVADLLETASSTSMLRHMPNQKVLDIGCGPGDTTSSLLLPFLPPDSQVLGVDISPEMVRHARAMYHSNPRLQFQEYNVESIDVHETNNLGQFDKIFSFWTLHWVQNQRVALQNVYNLLKSDGEILFLFFVTGPIYYLYETVSRYPRWSKYMSDVKKWVSPFHNRSDPCGDIKKLAKNLGFQNIQCTLESRSFEFPSMNVMLKSTEALDPFIKRVPADLRESFLLDYETEILKGLNGQVQRAEHGEGYVVHYKSIILYASKL